MVNWKHKLLLNVWALATLNGAISLIICLVGSATFTRLMAVNSMTDHMVFNEQPWKLSLFFTLSTITSLAITVAVNNSPPFQGALRRVMISGSAVAVLGLSLYGLYVGPLSTMQAAEGVPEVGEQAPDFAITDPTDRTWRLSDFHGDILLVFYRGYW
jgi:hypothetical protein